MKNLLKFIYVLFIKHNKVWLFIAYPLLYFLDMTYSFYQNKSFDYFLIFKYYIFYFILCLSTHAYYYYTRGKYYYATYYFRDELNISEDVEIIFLLKDYKDEYACKYIKDGKEYLLENIESFKDIETIINYGK